LVCILCNHEYTNGASLSSLKNHFKMKHREEFSKVPEFYSPFKRLINQGLNSNLEED
ncbi:3525_t:CDS:1, partial [Dentiscutata heterogama]